MEILIFNAQSSVFQPTDWDSLVRTQRRKVYARALYVGLKPDGIEERMMQVGIMNRGDGSKSLVVVNYTTGKVEVISFLAARERFATLYCVNRGELGVNYSQLGEWKYVWEGTSQAQHYLMTMERFLKEEPPSFEPVRRSFANVGRKPTANDDVVFHEAPPRVDASLLAENPAVRVNTAPAVEDAFQEPVTALPVASGESSETLALLHEIREAQKDNGASLALHGFFVAQLEKEQARVLQLEQEVQELRERNERLQESLNLFNAQAAAAALIASTKPVVKTAVKRPARALVKGLPDHHVMD